MTKSTPVTSGCPAPALLALTVVLLLAGCGERSVGDKTDASTPAAAVVAPTDRWLGKWIGPEGTWLEISGGAGAYRVVIANLDGPRSFDANAGPDRIVFERDGKRETIRATDGPGTGMKWLATKTDCLFIEPGEGFCRD